MASTSTVEPLSAMEESRNWVEMPDELMSNILGRLDTVEILNSAMEVCTNWRRICKAPSMWKIIDIRKPVDALDADCDYETLTKKAIDLSCGELIDISLEGFGTDHLLNYISVRSSKLRSLCLTNCYITGSGLYRALKRVPQLEKLHLSHTSRLVGFIDDLIVPNCPQLKSFKLDKVFIKEGIRNNNDVFAISEKMPELRHLQLYGNLMTNTGLEAILNGCLHLESLDVRTCYNIYLKGILEKHCMEQIKNFKGPYDSNENCGFHPRIYVNVDSDDDDYNIIFDEEHNDYYQDPRISYSHHDLLDSYM